MPRFLGLFLRGLTGTFSNNCRNNAHMTLRRLLAALLIAAVTPVVTLVSINGAFAADVKVVAKKTAKPIPSKSPKWPPQGFKGKDGVYAKVPTSKELIGLLSAKRSLQSTVRLCEKVACGAVIAAAETGCMWWEVNSNVFRLDPESLTREKIGSLKTIVGGSDKREQKTIFLVSNEEVAPGISLSGIKVICHRDAENKPKNGNTYSPIANPTPAITASPTPES